MYIFLCMNILHKNVHSTSKCLFWRLSWLDTLCPYQAEMLLLVPTDCSGPKDEQNEKIKCF